MAVMDDHLPPLPEPTWPGTGRERAYNDAWSVRAVLDIQREAYEAGKRAAVAAERARCVRALEAMEIRTTGEQSTTVIPVARAIAAIRATAPDTP